MFAKIELFRALLDLDTLEQAGSEFVSARLERRAADVVYRLRERASGNWVYVLLELQSTQDRWIPLRMFEYGNFIKTRHLQLFERAPIVIPLLLFNGQGRWSLPRRIGYCYHKYVMLDVRRWQEQVRYTLIAVQQLDERFLLDRLGVLGIVMWFDQIRNPLMLLERAHRMVQLRLREQLSRDELNLLAHWLRNMLVTRFEWSKGLSKELSRALNKVSKKASC